MNKMSIHSMEKEIVWGCQLLVKQENVMPYLELDLMWKQAYKADMAFFI